MTFAASRNLLFLAPGLGWLALFLLVPVGLVAAYSLFERGVYGGVVHELTADNFVRAADPLYLGVLLTSAKVAGFAAIAALLLGYPAAYAIARGPCRLQTPLLFLVMLPFWSNYLIRTYAWIVLLNKEGLANQALRALGYDGPAIDMLYTEATVVVGLVYNYLPFVILAVYASLSRLPDELWEASEDLGARGHNTFLRIILPLSLPGVAAGAVFVFVLSIGNFVTPDLLGGGKVQMVGNLIYDQFLTARDWPFGAALSLILIAVMMLLLFAQAVAVNRAQGAHRA